MPFLDTNSHLTTKPYNFDIKCQSKYEGYDRHGFFGTKFRGNQNFLITFGGFYNEREYSGADWLVLLIPKAQLRTLIQYCTVNSVDLTLPTPFRGFSFKARVKPDNSCWFEEANLKNLIVCQPDNRSAHCTLHSALVTAHCTLHTAHCTLHWSLHNAHFSLIPGISITRSTVVSS